MYSLKFVRHDKIDYDLLNEIINVKSVSWPYSYEKQVEWINTNLKDSDIHVLLYLENDLVAYLNLIEIEFKINANNYLGYGIGNVCALEKGRGWGKEIMKCTNRYLIENGKIGLLFCKESLVNFYQICEWKEINPKYIKLPIKYNNVISMIYNYPYEFKSVEFMGKLF